MTTSRLRMLPVILYVAIVFAASSIPNLQPPGPGFLLKDKIAHFGEYLVLGVLLFVAFGGVVGPSRAAGVLFLVAVGCSVGAMDELYQSFVPLRTMSAVDWTADLLGVTVGVLVALTLGSRRRSGMAEAGER